MAHFSRLDRFRRSLRVIMGGDMKDLTMSLITSVALSLTSAAVFAAESPSTYPGPWPGWHGYWPGAWWICPLMMMLMLVLFVTVFLILRRGRGGWPVSWRQTSEPAQDLQPPEVTTESALGILDRRYALGEIDKEEYEEKKTTILSTTKRSGGT